MFWIAEMVETSLPIFVLRVISPTIVFVSTLSLLFVRPTPPTSPSAITSVVVATAVPRRAAILSLLSILAATYLADGLAFVVYAIIDKYWPRHTGIPLNTIVGVASFSGLAALGAWKDVSGVEVWSLRRLKLAISASLILDMTLVVLLGFKLQSSSNEPHIPEKSFSIRVLLHLIFPAFRALLLFPLLASLLSPRVVYTPIAAEDVEGVEATASSFLLPPDTGNRHSTGLSGLQSDNSKYGTFHRTRSTLQNSAPVTRATTPAPSTGPDRSEAKPEISLEPTWSEVWARIRRLTPYLWPTKTPHLQFLAVTCILILVLGRVINLALPLTLGELVTILEGRSRRSPWPYLFGYVGLRFLQGSGGLAAIRDSLWAPVMQYSDREMSQLSFDHILNLSFAWHTRRKTGEILRVLDRGAAINHTFELILFNILPTFIDIFVALVAFCILFEWTIALVIFLVMFAYVAASVILTQYRTRLRRQMNDRDVITRGIHTDCLLNYETVKYFGGEEHEGERYREAIREYQALELKVIFSLNLLNLVQNFIITLGLLVGSMLVAHGITQGEPQASKFVIFITYLAQLYGPLNQLGYIYRSVNQSLVDTERLLALLNEPTDVNDKPDAPELAVTAGEIEFQDVSFSYDERTTALNRVSFKVPKGSSVALVGESGSGKSTILRLLYRFYDLREGEGSILIDGQDIRDVTQKSLRQAIGVVPQDSVLFNTTISYNIGYGKFGATLEEIEAAARSAQMHDRIMSFPDGYDTKVGERGVRLSGGEKQRVAIARTLLKNPPILLLDEATSALDTSTEKDIQKALQNLVKGRSSLSIAHRLSTIASADIILVLKDGQIIEYGSHKELIALDGVFASMWADQISSSEDPPASISGSSLKKEPSGYNVDMLDSANDNQGDKSHSAVEEIQIAAEDETFPINMAEDEENIPLTSTSEDNDGNKEETQHDIQVAEAEVKPIVEEVQSIVFPSANAVESDPQGDQSSTKNSPTSHEDAPTPREDALPIATPSPIAPTPVKFPDSSESGTRQPERVATPNPIGVTFGASAFSPPSRTSTPDPDAEPKRKRISSQNFQRFARRISLTTRRQGSVSSIIPGLKRDQSPRVSVEDARAESSAAALSDSPASSVKGNDKAKNKKDKKDKNKKGSI